MTATMMRAGFTCPQCGEPDLAVEFQMHYRADAPGDACKWVRLMRTSTAFVDDAPVASVEGDEILSCQPQQYVTAVDAAIEYITESGLPFTAAGNGSAHFMDQVAGTSPGTAILSAHLYGFTPREVAQVVDGVNHYWADLVEQ